MIWVLSSFMTERRSERKKERWERDFSYRDIYVIHAASLLPIRRIACIYIYACVWVVLSLLRRRRWRDEVYVHPSGIIEVYVHLQLHLGGKRSLWSFRNRKHEGHIPLFSSCMLTSPHCVFRQLVLSVFPSLFSSS